MSASAGSILFAGSSLSGIFTYLASHHIYSRVTVAYPYAFGSVLYTWGAYWSVVASTQILKSFSTPDSRASSQATSAQPSAHSRAAADPSAAINGRSQPSSSTDRLHVERPPLDQESAAAGEGVCCGSGRGFEQVQLSRNWHQRFSKGWRRFKAGSLSPIYRCGGQNAETLTDHDWAKVDWSGASPAS